MSKWCVFCPEPRRAIGEVDGDPVCVMCGAEAGSSFVRYREVPKPEPVRVTTVVCVGEPGNRRYVKRALPKVHNPGQRTRLLYAALRNHAGTASDSTVAQRIGCAKETVANYRRRHGIAPYRDTAERSLYTAERNRERGKDTWERIRDFVGKWTDAEIETLTGVPFKTVCAARRRHGIAAYDQSKSHRRQKKIHPGALPVNKSVYLGVTENVQ